MYYSANVSLYIVIMAANNGDAAAKLGLVFKPLLDEVKKELMAHITVASQEVLLAVGKVEARVDVLEKLVGEKKKATTRGEKKTAGATTEGETAPAGAEVQVVQPTGAQKAPPINKLVYFRDQFKTNPEYRARYVTPEIEALMNADASIAGKTNEAQKLIAQATFCWNYFKANRPDITEAIEKEFQALKAARDASNKPPQQTVEPKTPPGTQ